MLSSRSSIVHCILLTVFCVGAALVGAQSTAAQLPPATIGPVQLSPQPEIDAGFRLMYELKFAEAQATFIYWEAAHPGEALGAAAEAARIVFQEFDRLGVLTADFFLDDKRLLGGVQGTPDPVL